MLRHQLIHPKINEVLGRAGHHATILIADGNYPASSKKGPNAEVVCLNLMPGVVSCTQVLQAVLSAMPIEAVNTMMYETTGQYALSEDPPVWAEYRRTLQQAGSTLSGGEQQMLALARALMARPKLLLADEVSLGLAPVITKQVFGHLKVLREQGMTILVVEQNAHLLMKMADYIYVLKHGRVALEGKADEMASHRELTEAYLGE